MKYDKDKIVRDLRKYLKNFFPYEETHYISVYSKDSLYINYSNLLNSQQKKYFELEIKEDNCNIISPYIEEGNGYSNLLADIIESFCCNELNCRRFVTTPSIKLKKEGFWDKRGFRYMNAIVLEKLIQD